VEWILDDNILDDNILDDNVIDHHHYYDHQPNLVFVNYFLFLLNYVDLDSVNNLYYFSHLDHLHYQRIQRLKYYIVFGSELQHPEGFIDDQPHKQHAEIYGVPRCPGNRSKWECARRSQRDSDGHQPGR
jgi:hypothetical protein